MYPTILYHRSNPKGKTFTDQQEHDDALKIGWVTAPWLINEPIVVFKEDTAKYPKKRRAKSKK